MRFGAPLGSPPRAGRSWSGRRISFTRREECRRGEHEEGRRPSSDSMCRGRGVDAISLNPVDCARSDSHRGRGLSFGGILKGLGGFCGSEPNTLRPQLPIAHSATLGSRYPLCAYGEPRTSCCGSRRDGRTRPFRVLHAALRCRRRGHDVSAEAAPLRPRSGKRNSKDLGALSAARLFGRGQGSGETEARLLETPESSSEGNSTVVAEARPSAGNNRAYGGRVGAGARSKAPGISGETRCEHCRHLSRSQCL